MMKNGFKVGPTEMKVLAFIRKLDKETRRAFSPAVLIKKGYQGDAKVLGNTLPRLAKKGFVTRLCKGMYKSASAGSRRTMKKEREVISIPRKKLTSEEWKVCIEAAMEKAQDYMKTCDRKIEECHEKIKEAQSDIETWSSEKKKAEARMEGIKKVFDAFTKNPHGFGEIVEILQSLKDK